MVVFFFFQAEDGIRDLIVTGVQTCALPISTLVEQGLLRRTSTGRYKLGWRVMALSQVLLSTTDFRTEARPLMESLIARFGETVHLAALESGQVIYFDKLQGTRAVQVSVTAVG